MHPSLFDHKARILTLVICLFLAACQRSTAKTAVAGFIPPTEIPVPTKIVVTVASNPTPQVNCVDVLSFSDDITIPDGTVVKPGEELEKKWQVRNNGTCDWTDKYTLRIIAGDPLGSPDSQPLYPARSGSVAPIRMILKAPETPGGYRTAWQAFNAAGKAFGDVIYIDIVVQ